jgi:2-polyprenyl-3-methyl-5-hydroxy-6-metoxy-1,4-benzoquinol methylase
LLTYTGERVIPELMKPSNGLLLEHLARYSFSIPYVKGRVLDIACGSGYGTHMIAKACKKVTDCIVGVDVDPYTIKYATKQYHHPKIKYQEVDAINPKLPFVLGKYDTILSFETIEHVTDDMIFMKNLYNLLKPGGTLVLSTPFGQGRGKPCSSPFHIHQYTKQEFIELFQDFSHVEYYFQRGVAIELGLSGNNGLSVNPPRDNVRYPLGIAVCTK